MKIQTKQRLAVTLSILGSIGTVFTAVLTRKAAKKELEIRNNIQKKPGEEISKKQILKVLAPVYIPVIAVGTATIASTISSTILSRKAEASLTAMALLADQGWRKYKGQVKNKLGLDKHGDILKSIGESDSKNIKKPEKDDSRQLYFEDHIGFFRADPEKFALAFSDLNQRLQLEDYGVSAHYTMLYDLVKGCEADIIDKTLDIQDLRWGWSAEYLSAMCGYVWVHMNLFDAVSDEGEPFKTVVWGEEPFLDPGNFGEVFLNRGEEHKEPHQFKSALPAVKNETK